MHTMYTMHTMLIGTLDWCSEGPRLLQCNVLVPADPGSDRQIVSLKAKKESNMDMPFAFFVCLKCEIILKCIDLRILVHFT